MLKKLSVRLKLVAVICITFTIFIVAVVAWNITRGEAGRDRGDTISRVGQHILLPDNEQPAQLSIVDRSKITSNFLEKAQNGDKVLIYQDNQLAIIYRPSIDRIVDTSKVQIDDVRSLERK